MTDSTTEGLERWEPVLGEYGGIVGGPRAKMERDQHGDWVAYEDVVAALAQQRQEIERLKRQPESEGDPRSCRDDDDCPTEGAVLKREWREQRQEIEALRGMVDSRDRRCEVLLRQIEALKRENEKQAEQLRVFGEGFVPRKQYGKLQQAHSEQQWDLQHQLNARTADNETLKRELAKHQKSEFHPDWSLLEACRDSLREHMKMLRQATDEARSIAVAMHRDFYSEVEQWEPLPDVVGLLTQIDNMYAGIREKYAALKRERETIVAHACTECPKTVACKGLGYCGLQHPDREALERERDDACSERDDAIRIAQSAKTAHLSTKADNAALRDELDMIKRQAEDATEYVLAVENQKLRARCDDLHQALTDILGWRETDLPEGNRGARAIEYMEERARAVLQGEDDA